MPELKPAPDAGGIYVHVPFCLRKCPYCDFYSVTDRSLLPRFLSALRSEVELIGDRSFACDTLYLGGGTPSLLDPDQAGAVVAAVARSFNLSPHAEITLEVNPGTVDLKRLRGYREAGFNRLSVGVQSFSSSNLAFLGRIHSADEARRGLEWAREAGFDNIGLDLIYGLPGQSVAAWTTDLRCAAAFGPQHLSCYALTYEKGTELDRLRHQGRVHPLPDARVGGLYRTAVAVLADSGYTPYEISNFACSAAHRSRHNRKYWNFSPYIGLGPSAHSYLPPLRRWNRADVGGYVEQLEQGMLPVAGEEVLTRQQKMIEAVYLGLRQTDGVSLSGFEGRFGEGFRKVFGAELDRLAEENLLRLGPDDCRLTLEGRLFLDAIAARLVSLLD